MGGPVGLAPSGLAGAGLFPSSSVREPCYPVVSTQAMTKAKSNASCVHVDKIKRSVGTMHVGDSARTNRSSAVSDVLLSVDDIASAEERMF